MNHIDNVREVLDRIIHWRDFPPTGRVFGDGSPMSYGAVFGSNGERDHMRYVATDARRSLTLYEREVAEMVKALSDCVEALTFLEERTAIRINPPTLENARAILAKVKP